MFLRGNDLDELRQHSHQTGHVGFCENDDINAPGATEVVEGAEPTGGKSGKGRIAAAAAVGLGVATALGGLLAEVAELVSENDYLKSASGAGTTLRSYGN
ncbi:hypothetical protein [Streptomyces gardneri]|uniref:hypothetical protein n=1 Tax=Streptomyces gardneri TaxID=66892 RepID=UPI0037D6A07A